MVKNRRSVINYSIKRQMQIRLLLRVMVIALLAAGLTSIFFYVYSSQEVGQSFKQFHVNARTFLDFLFPFIIMALVAGTVTALGVALFFPHRIAGPLYRIERDIKEKVANGDFTVKFSVRKGDEVRELADALNTMVEKLRLKLCEIKSASDELLRLSSGAERDDAVLQRFQDVARRIEGTVREFKL